MHSTEIRRSFLEFFKSRNHEVVKSSSLIPHHDPTLLFTNAGMVQFKSVFLGEEKREYVRAATSQKCMRAGGKHSDIENVGHTARHHTFFEMLGNFSFGDYFKKEAIQFAWELLTGRFDLPEDRLWVSVYQEDDEAAFLWHELTGMPPSRIVRLGAKDNFWQMGDTGPCGPCSEIIIDQGEDVGCGKPGCAVGCDCDRYLELWNLVFMQYNRDENGTLTPLPKPSIDTGMGLERISSVLQGKRNNFDTDLFAPIIDRICSLSGVSYGHGRDTDVSIRVMADHVRASTFLLTDGLMPSNEGRGYVLRRIIRRASRHARLLGCEGAILHRLVDAVVEAMGGTYHELAVESSRAAKVLLFEEDRFTRTLDQGVRLLDDIINKLKKDGNAQVPGESLFRLYDTFGFPLDLARDIAADNNLTIDEPGFHREMEMQRERARASWVGEGEAVASVYRELASDIGETRFIGYDTLVSEATATAILKSGEAVTEAQEGDSVEVFFDASPFYAESGGQVGDAGSIAKDGFRAEVVDTKKEASLHAHIVQVKEGSLRVGDRVRCVVYREIRRATQRSHTATHLLHAALRLVLGDHVKQAGSHVAPDRLRFDFSHFSHVDRKELDMIEDLVNEKIRENILVETEVSDIGAALKAGVLALFGEKYGERVRIVRTPGFSAELCGGTHCRSTGDIGLFTIASEGSVASGIRRIEASTGKNAFDILRGQRQDLQSIAHILRSDHPVERAEGILNELREREKEVLALKTRLSAYAAREILTQMKIVDGVKVIASRVADLDQEDIRLLADSVRDRLGSGVLVIASLKDGRASAVAMVSKDLSPRFHAGKILKAVLARVGGKGGGKAEMAQGGTGKIENIGSLDEALEHVYSLVRGG